MFDYIIVGSGFYGATCARLLAEKNYKIKLIEKNYTVGGNCRTTNREGIIVHECGPHMFHTNNQDVWNFVNRFSEFNDRKLKVRVNYKNKIYSFPINLLTLNQVYGCTTPKEAIQAIEKDRIPNNNPQNFEEAALNVVGSKLYNIFFKGYTKKQWNMDPVKLDYKIFSRLPVRFDYDDGYFLKHRCKYEGFPTIGYSKLIENMLNHSNIEIILNVDYLKSKKQHDQEGLNVIYTGPIDAYFEFKYGVLPYRSLRFEHEKHDGDYQGGMIVNYTDEEVPFTRITEHKHFMEEKFEYTYITKEYPQSYDGTNEPLYPINDNNSMKIFEEYKKLITQTNVHFGGRLAEYKYYDMDQTIESAMNFCNIIERKI